MMSIELPERTRASLHAVADGEWKTRPEPFIDTLLEEEAVKKNPEALLTTLLLVSIRNGII